MYCCHLTVLFLSMSNWRLHACQSVVFVHIVIQYYVLYIIIIRLVNLLFKVENITYVIFFCEMQYFLYFFVTFRKHTENLIAKTKTNGLSKIWPIESLNINSHSYKSFQADKNTYRSNLFITKLIAYPICFLHVKSNYFRWI